MGVTLPYTITNGTPHDAVPVQRNFEALRDAHNAHVHDGVDTPKVSFANIDGKPATYPPSAHTHAGTDVTSAVAEATHAVNADNATNSHKVDGCDAGMAPNNVLKLDANGKVPAANLPGGVFMSASDGPCGTSPVLGRSHVDTDYGSWRKVGPTGSGANIIWTALDSVPVGARAVRLNLYAYVLNPTATDNLADYYVGVGFRKGGATWFYPAIRAAYAKVSLAGQIAVVQNTVDVPLDSNRVFEMYWTKGAGQNIELSLQVYLEGWYA